MRNRRSHVVSCCCLVTLLFWSPVLSPGTVAANKARAEAGTLSVVSEPPGVTVYVDGQVRGETPLDVNGLPAGDHRVKFVKPGYLENSRVVTLRKDRALTVEVKLTPADGQPRNAVQVRGGAGGGGGLLTNPFFWTAVGAGAGVGTYFAVRDPNDPPFAGTVNISPGGTGLAAATRFSFTSQGASDPDRDPLTFTWNFGDGGSGTGQTVDHTYNSAGTFTVTVTVSDGKESASASGSVTVKALAGNWVGTGTLPGERPIPFSFVLQQSGTLVTGTYLDEDGAGTVNGSVSPQRGVRLTVTQPPFFPFTFDGEADSTVDRITGTVVGIILFTMNRQ